MVRAELGSKVIQKVYEAGSNDLSSEKTASHSRGESILLVMKSRIVQSTKCGRSIGAV
jgi:hypothetical protein